MKTYKIYKGEIIDVSQAIDFLYEVRYFLPEKNQFEIDWLYFNKKELKIGEKVKVYDSTEKYIMEMDR